MARPQQFDRNALHRLLWSRTDQRGLIKLKQADLAEELNIGKAWMSQLIHEFKSQGRLVQLSAQPRRGGGSTMYRVTDPGFWTDPIQKEVPMRSLSSMTKELNGYTNDQA
jgi:hypothetical protein